MRQRKIQLALILPLLLSAYLTGCGTKQASDNLLSVSILPQKYFIDQLSGGALEVNVMVPPGSSHSSYSPTTKQFQKLSDSKLYIGVGNLGYEAAWLPRLGEINPEMKMLTLSDHTELISASSDHHKDDGHAHGVDPHIWMSPSVVKQLIPLIRDALIENFPQLKDTIEANYPHLMAIVEKADKEMRATTALVKTREFMIFHPALSYLARDYNLVQHEVEVEGKEPSPAYLASLIETAKSKSVSVIFIQEEYDIRNAETIAEEAGIALATINPMAYDWEETMAELNLTFQKYLNE